MVNPSKVFITGHHGQLGHELVRQFEPVGEVRGADLPDFDICDQGSVRQMIESFQPDLVLHTAAYTDVDEAESATDKAFAVNAEGTRNVALVCRDIGAGLVYYSTDYVFDGTKSDPYCEDDTPAPLNVYGRSKLEGERQVADLVDNHCILRISWLYGHPGNNFVKTMLSLAQKQAEQDQNSEVKPLRIVNDQFGSPCWTHEVAMQTATCIKHDLRGLFHATAEGDCSWYEFAADIFSQSGLEVKSEPCSTAEFPRPAKRPANSVLENQRLKRFGHNCLRDWRVALGEFLNSDRQ